MFLWLTIATTAIAAGAQFLRRQARTRRLRQLAARQSMHYSPGDRFRFASKVAEHFPVPGAADVRVSDVIYGSRDELHRYVFAVDYTRGVVRTKRRLRRVAAFVEPRGQRERRIELHLADPALPALQQYETLCDLVSAAGKFEASVTS
jgi:hypothetical protein